MRGDQRDGRQNYDRDGFRGYYRNQSYKRGRGRLYDRQFRDNNRRDNRSASVTVDQSQALESSTNRDRIKCFECREYAIILHNRLPNNTNTQRGGTNSTNVQYRWRRRHYYTCH